MVNPGTRAAFILAALIFGGAAPAAAPDLRLLSGEWRGEGRFLNAGFQKVHGPLPIGLRIDSEGALSGMVGAATVGSCDRKVRAELVEYICTLSVPVGAQPAFAGKDHFVLLVVSVDSSGLASNFHLKASRWFDPGQHIGEWIAIRQPAQD